MRVEVHHMGGRELNTYNDLYILPLCRYNHISPIHRHDHRLIRRRLDILNTCSYTKTNTIRLTHPSTDERTYP